MSKIFVLWILLIAQLKENLILSTLFSGCKRTLKNVQLKFIYSEKATKFWKISTLDLSYVVMVKSTVEILQNFVTFSEYMNFIISGQQLNNLFLTIYLMHCLEDKQMDRFVQWNSSLDSLRQYFCILAWVDFITIVFMFSVRFLVDNLFLPSSHWSFKRRRMKLALLSLHNAAFWQNLVL